jgi:hypothetical protein
MTIKIFLTYEPDGKVIGQTHEEAVYFEKRKTDGELVFEIPSQLDYKAYKIDVNTMTLVAKTPEEIEAERPKPIEPMRVMLPGPYIEGQLS